MAAVSSAEAPAAAGGVGAVAAAPAASPTGSSCTTLVVWDFDFSLLVSCNSDEAIPDALAAAAGCAPLSASFIRPRAAAMQWTDLMDEVCGVLAAPPYRASRAALEAAAGALPASAPVLDAVRALARGGAQQAILSDANSVYIAAFLRAHALEGAFTAIITNPAQWEADAAGGGERLRVRRHHPPHAPPHGCARCPVNLCKGAALDELLLALAAASAGAAPAGAAGAAPLPAPPAQFSRVVYVGDGRGDVCPALRLRADDVVLARAGFPLATALEGEAALKAKVVVWADGDELAREVLRLGGVGAAAGSS